MFHLFLGLPALGALAVLGTVVLQILVALVWGGFWITGALALFCKKNRKLVWLPVIPGVIACLVCLALDLMLEPVVALVFWAIYLMACLLGGLLGSLIRCILLWVLN